MGLSLLLACHPFPISRGFRLNAMYLLNTPFPVCHPSHPHRQTSELPLTTQITSMGVASLLGIGYMMMHAWESRNKPYTKYWQHQVEGLTGNRLQADTPVWREATSFAHA